jgi:hypothetical protein
MRVPAKNFGFCVPLQPHCVGEGKVAEVIRSDMAVLDQLTGLGSE